MPPGLTPVGKMRFSLFGDTGWRVRWVCEGRQEFSRDMATRSSRRGVDDWIVVLLDAATRAVVRQAVMSWEPLLRFAASLTPLAFNRKRRSTAAMARSWLRF